MLLHLAQLAILARVLGADDFGHFAIVSVISALTISIADLGLSSSVVHFDEANEKELRALFWLSMVSSLCWVALVASSSAVAAVVLNKPTLFVNVASGLGVGLLAIVGSLPKARAERALRFRALVQLEIAAQTLGLLCAVSLALNGAGVIALVAGVAAQQFFLTFCLWARLERSAPPGICFDFSLSRRYLRFGLPLTGSRLVNTVGAQCDVYVASLFFSPQQLGEYSVPRSIGLQVQGLINPLMTRLSFPLIASAQSDRSAVSTLYETVLMSTSSINAPAYAFLFFFAEEVSFVLLGNGWSSGSEFLKIFAIWGALRALGNPVGSLLLGVGRPGLALRWDIAVALVMASAVALTVNMGPVVLAQGLVAALAVLYVPLWFFLVMPNTQISLPTYVSVTLWPMLLAVCAGFTSSLLMAWSSNPLGTLLFGGTLMCLLYGCFSAALNKPWVLLMLEMMFGQPRAIEHGRKL